MDNSFYSSYPGETDYFMKAIFKRQVKRVAKKTAQKAGMSPAQTKALQNETQQLINKGALGKKITGLNRAGNIIAIAGGTALTAGLATGAIPGLVAAKGTGIVATAANAGKKIIAPVKKIASKVVSPNVDPTPWLGGNPTKTTAGQAINALKNIAREKAPEVMQGLKEKGLAKVAEIIGNNQTSPELLPKTAPQKQLEATIINGGATPLGAIDTMLKNPLIVGGILVLIIAVVFAMLKRNA